MVVYGQKGSETSAGNKITDIDRNVVAEPIVKCFFYG